MQLVQVLMLLEDPEAHVLACFCPLEDHALRSIVREPPSCLFDSDSLGLEVAVGHHIQYHEEVELDPNHMRRHKLPALRWCSDPGLEILIQIDDVGGLGIQMVCFVAQLNWVRSLSEVIPRKVLLQEALVPMHLMVST